MKTHRVPGGGRQTTRFRVRAQGRSGGATIVIASIGKAI